MEPRHIRTVDPSLLPPGPAPQQKPCIQQPARKTRAAYPGHAPATTATQAGGQAGSRGAKVPEAQRLVHMVTTQLHAHPG